MTESNGNRVIVLGATGFLGAYSCLALAEAGFEVFAVGHRDSDGGFFGERGMTYIGGFRIEDKGSFERLPTEVAAVVNLAGSMPARADFGDRDYVDSILIGTLNLCGWMRDRTQCRKIVFNTTPSDVWREFGVDKVVGDDVMRAYPATGGDHDVYAIAKMAATDVLDHFRLSSGFQPIIFRHLNVYGFHPSANYMVDGEMRLSPWRIILRRALSGQDVAIYGDGSRRLELLSVYDFATAVVCAIRAKCTGMFNLAGDRPYTLEEEIRTIVDVFGHGNKVILEPERPSRMESVLSREKARCLLGWEPKLSWRDTCCRMRGEFSGNRFRMLWGEVADEDRQ